MTSSAASLSPCYVHLTRLPNIPEIPFKPYRRKSRVCPKCDEYFKNRKDFTKHLLHHLSRRSHKKKQTLKLPQNRKKCCPICQEVFRKKWDLIQHLVIHLTDLEKQAEKKRKAALADKPKTEDKKPLIQTKLNFKSSKLLQRKIISKSTSIHQQNLKASNPFERLPKKTLPKSTSIQIQEQSHKTCNQRKMVLTSNSSTWRKVSVNRKTWKLVCYFCGMKWPKLHTLKDHITRHTGEQPHACPHPGCHARYKRVGSLNVHMRIHDPDGPPKYECHRCEKTCNQRSSLNVHIRSVHLKIRDFKCSKCKRGFIRRKDMESHMEKYICN